MYRKSFDLLMSAEGAQGVSIFCRNLFVVKRRFEVAQDLVVVSRQSAAFSISFLLMGGSFWAHFALGPVFFAAPVFLSWGLLHALVFLAAFKPGREGVLFGVGIAVLHLYLSSLLRVFEAPLIPAAPLFFVISALTLIQGFRRFSSASVAWVISWVSVLGWLTWRQDLSFALSPPWIFSMIVSAVFLAGVHGAFRRFAKRLHQSVKALGPRSEFESVRSQQAKLQGLGELTASLVHEISTPITSILGFSYQAREAYRDPGGVPAGSLGECLERIEANAQRVAKLTKALRSYSRLESRDHRPVPLFDVLDDAVSLVGPSFRLKNVRLNWKRPENESCWVEGDFVGLSQVFVNLLTNGRDAAALQHGSKEDESGSHAIVEIRVQNKDGFVCVEVYDSGAGVPNELRNRIFEPYFTTKAVGEGTGLGLSLAQKTVAAHRGRIELRPACFAVLFPLIQSHEAQQPSDKRKIA